MQQLMTRTPFDQLAKQYLQEFLEPLGQVKPNLEVPGEAKYVDIWFLPSTTTPPPVVNLGLLGRIARTACLIEPFRNSPTRQQTRACLLKLLWIQEEQRRRREQTGSHLSETDLPRLWILAAIAYRPIIAAFGGRVQAEWGAGVYFLSEGLKAAIVAINQLPPTRETLWLRLLGRGATQRRAIAEVLALPPDDPQREQALQLLTNWRITLELSDEIEPEEEQLMAALSQAYLEWERQTEERGRQAGIERGIEQGIERGSQQEARSLVLRLLHRRVGEVPEAMRSQITALSLTELESLAEALLEFTGLSDLEQWLAQGRS